MIKNDKGLGVVGVLLIVITTGILGFTIWYFLKPQSHPAKTAETKIAPTAQVSTKTSEPVVNTQSEQQTVTNPNGDWASIQIPKNWYYQVCDGGIYVGLGSSKASAGVCNSGATAELSLTVSNDFVAPTSASTTKESTTVDSVVGAKYTEQGEADSPLAGNTIITYAFTTKGKTYSARYTHAPSSPDNSATVDKIVKTWKF